MIDVVGTSLAQQDIALLNQAAVGAVILFSRNYESKNQLMALVTEIKSLRNPSLLIAVDQEGGRVQRFREGFFNLPAMYSFSTIFDDDPKRAIALCESAGMVMASEVAATGIDFSFAPVLDCVDLNSQVIGDRGFHHNPYAITELAGAFVDGMNRAGMSAIGKHFPGHGGVVADSHTGLPVDHRPLSDLQSCDLVPFEKLAHRLGGVMTAHISFPEIDASLPTYSSFWLRSLLRETLGFEGVIFSDDLTMKGAVGVGSPLRRCELALDAGCDMALICNDPDAAIAAANSIAENYVLDPKRIEAMRGRPGEPARDLEPIREKLAAFC